MVALTLSDPDVIFIEPSQAKDNNTERAYSYVYAKTFKRNGEKIKYFTSVTVAKEGLEISVSSHFVNPNKMKNKLMEFERAYTKETLLPNSSEMRLTEHQSDVPDLLPTQGNNVSSAGKDTQSSNNEQGSSVKNQESDAIPTNKEVGITQSNSVLQGEEVDNSRGDNESQEQGGTIEVGTQGEVENGFVHQGAQGGKDKLLMREANSSCYPQRIRWKAFPLLIASCLLPTKVSKVLLQSKQISGNLLKVMQLVKICLLRLNVLQ